MTNIMDYFNSPTEADCANPCRQSAQKREPLREGDIKRFRDIMECTAMGGIEYTQTFLPELTTRFNAESLSRILRDRLKRYQKRYKFTCLLVGEYSPLGLYHYHGAILAPAKMINSIRRCVSREIGRLELKQIKYVQSYVAYCFKDENHLQEFHKSRELWPEDIIYLTPAN